MSDGANVVYMSEVGIDYSQLKRDVDEINRLITQTSISVNELMQFKWNPGDAFAARAANGDQQAKAIVEATKRLNEHKAALEATNTKAATLGGTILKTFAGYQGLNLGKKALTETLETMKEVESQMIAISRVLDLNTESTTRLRDEIFSLGKAYGTSFKDTAQITQTFAQAGYSASESLELAKSSLLAMNTAELDAKNSTQSMIGILKQWNLEASDLATVIDKLNYTADHNAVTTQDLVDGLLRSSSAAKNANISFDETVGLLVAIGEASGRSGKEIGTALNSLISFTRRATSRDVFESMGVKVYLDKAKTSMVPLIEQWKQLSDMVTRGGSDAAKTLSEMPGAIDLVTEEMAGLVGMQEEYNTLFDQSLNDMEKMQIYNQASTFRQNFWIALLQNFEKISEVVGDMPNAIGHSMRENEKAMQTFEKRMEQLKISLHELAVQAGDAGLMDIAKGAVTAATATANLIKNVGGIIPLLITLSGLLAIIKRDSLAKSFTGIDASVISSITNTTNSLKALALEAELSGDKIKGIGAAIKTTEAAASLAKSGVSGWLGIITMAIGVITQVVSAVKQHNEEMRRQSIEAGNSASEQIKSINEIYAAYKRLSEIEKRTDSEQAEYENLQSRINEILKHRAEILTGVTYGTEEYTEKLKEATKAELEYYEAAMKSGFKAAGQELEAASKKGFLNFDAGNVGNALYDALQYSKELKDVVESVLGKYSAGIASTDIGPKVYEAPKNKDELLKYYYDLIEAKILLSNYDNLNPEAKVTESKLWDDITNSINSLTEATKKYLEYKVWSLSSEFERSNGLVESAGDYERLKQSIYDALQATEAEKSAIDEALSKQYPGFSSAINNTTEKNNDLTQSLGELKKALADTFNELGNLENAYETLAAANEELANTGSITAAMLNKLIDNDLLKYLEFTEQGIWFNVEALKADFEALKADAIATATAAANKEIFALAASYAGTEAQNAKTPIDNVGDAAKNAGEKAAEGAKGLVDFAIAAAGVNQKNLSDFAHQYNEIADRLKQTIAGINALNFSAGGGSGGGSGGGKSQAEKDREAAIKGTTDAINDRIKALQNEEKIDSDLRKKQIESLRELQRETAASYKAQEEAAKRRYDREIEKLKEQEDAVKTRYDAEIKALQDIKNEANQQDDRADYLKSRSELEAERADMEKRTGREAVERIKEIDKQLADLDENERRRQRDVDIDYQIKAIEEMRDAELESIQYAMDKEKARYDRRIANIQAEAEREKEQLEEKIKGIELLGEIEKKKTEETIESLRKELEEVKKSTESQSDSYKKAYDEQMKKMGEVGENNKTVSMQSDAAFKTFMDNATKYSSDFRNAAVKDADSVLAAYQRALAAMNAIGSPTGTSGTPQIKAPGAATGGYVLSEGLVNLHPGEIVVREDITRGLMEFVQASRASTTQNFNYNNTHNYEQAVRPSVNITSPLVVIQKQEFKSEVDMKRHKRELEGMMGKYLNGLISR